jgi:hypothetical protein
MGRRAGVEGLEHKPETLARLRLAVTENCENL